MCDQSAIKDISIDDWEHSNSCDGDDISNSSVDNDDGTFYFESDSLALRGNEDYLKLMKTLAVLESQRIQMIKDLEEVIKLREELKKDPIAFVSSLQEGASLPIPPRVIIAQEPDIDWSKYNLSSVPEYLRPKTRYSHKPTGPSEELNIPKKEKDTTTEHAFPEESSAPSNKHLWTADEQRKLEELLIQYPSEEVESNRWKKIAAALGNRTPVQVCSRVQKYFLKLQKAGLPIPGRSPKTQALESLKRSSHRHQRNNHLLFRPTTFFPDRDVPVVMTDTDEIPPAATAVHLEQATKSDQAQEASDNSEETTEDAKVNDIMKKLELLKKVKESKLSFDSSLVHDGFKCDFCKEEPIKGTRWHCNNCSPYKSIDFCTDCVVTQLESSNPHPISHQLEPIKNIKRVIQVWDQDYFPHSYAENSELYNYLDPNYMPD